MEDRNKEIELLTLKIEKLQEGGLIKKPWSTHRYNSAKTDEGKRKVLNVFKLYSKNFLRYL